MMDLQEDNFSRFSLLAAEAIDEFWSLLGSEAKAGKLPQYTSIAQRLDEAAGNADLPGLQSLCAMLEANLQTIEHEGREMTPRELQLLEAWPELLMGYVIGQGEAGSVDLLLQNLASGDWPLPMGGEDVSLLRQMLVASNEGAAVETGSNASSADGAAAPAGQHADSMVIEAESPRVLIPEPAAENTIPSDTVQEVGSEMISMLVREFEQIVEQLDEDMSAAVSTHFSATEKHIALTNYADLIERLGMAADSVGLVALGKVFARLKICLDSVSGALSLAQHELLAQLPGRVTSYLTWPADISACAALMDLLADTAWQHYVASQDIAAWVAALSNVELVEGEENKPERQTEASDEDVSLAIPDDINAELLDGLLQELPLQTAAFTAAIERISAGVGTASDVSRAMRSAHTLKGAANTVGVKGIARLTHHLEDILVALTEENVVPNQELAAVLVNAGDCLEAMSETLMGVGPAPGQAREIFQSVLDYANRIDRDGVGDLSVVAATAVEAGVVSADTDMQKTEAQESAAREKNQGLRVSAPVVDELLRLAGETLISNSQIQDRLHQTVRQADAMRQQQHLLSQLIAELENLVDIRGVAAPLMEENRGDEFDPLEFDNYSELHTVTRRLIEASSDSQQIMAQVKDQFTELEDLLELQQRLQIANQHAVIRTRMVPVSSVVSRLQRSVRQTCRLLDKQVDLHISGEATNIDSNVLTDLMDPLMHILRNAVDHGMDDPESRLSAGKPEVGQIQLGFAREGNSIVVRCKDDGAGLDYDAIRRIAESKGMIAPERNPTPEELARLILVNGFSTRDETTEVSGRGVGMDIVYNRVLQMKGTLALNSERGLGLTVELRLPATLLSAHALVVRHDGQLLAISTRGVEDIHYVMPQQIENIGNQPVYRVGNAVHNLMRLERLLSLPADRREADRLGFPVLLTRMDDGSVSAIMVQEVIDGREVVLKNFGKYVPKIQGAIGAVILGDGTVAPVIDLVELLRVPVHRELTDQSASREEAERHGELHDSQTALVVDDSLTARRAAAKVMKDAGYNVRTAIDGLEAVAILQNYVPDIMLVDMEMPRMNGLELTSHVRNAERTKNVPVIMITSRSTEKHRQQGLAAGVNVYLTKPFSDEKLIDHVARLTGQAA